jgi:hypothetical protein
MSDLPVATEKQLKELLELAEVRWSNTGARSWLQSALLAAGALNPTKKKEGQRPLPTDHSERMADIARAASKLNRELVRLRSHPYSWAAFWRAVETRLKNISVIMDEEDFSRYRARSGRLDDRTCLATLGHLASAAEAAKESRMGRPLAAEKQHIVDLAFGFFARYSPLKPSGTHTGAFGEFARAFHAAAIKRDAGDLDRQIRVAMSRLPIQEERARHLFGQNRKPAASRRRGRQNTRS